MSRILIVDDDPEFAEELGQYLQDHGLVPTIVNDPARVPDSIELEGFDAILLDQRMPGTSGLDVLRRLRAVSAIPCIFVTGSLDDVEKIVSLEVGADDYVSKTAPPRELLARIRAVLRRAANAPQRQGREDEPGWSFSEERRDLYRPDGSACGLTTAEFEVMRLLVRAKGTTVTREEICWKVFNRPFRPGDRGPDMVIVKLRRILEPSREENTVLKSVRPFGYVFTGFPETEPAAQQVQETPG